MIKSLVKYTLVASVTSYFTARYVIKNRPESVEQVFNEVLKH